MYTLSLEIVNKCNLNCTYCYLGEKKNVFMSMDVAKKAVEIGIHEAQKQFDKTLIIYFIGGEPLLAFHIIKEIVFCVKKECEENNVKYIFSITTNGTLLTEDIVTFFGDNQFEIKLSLDGEKDIHDLNRKDYAGKGSYQILSDNMKFLENYDCLTGIPVSFAHVVTGNNYRFLSKSYQFLLDSGCKRIETGIDYYFDWKPEELEELKEELIKTFCLYKSYIQKNKKWFFWNLFEEHLRMYLLQCDFYACKAGLNNIFIVTNGNIYTCIELPEFLIGNVWTGLDVKKIREIVYIKDKFSTRCVDCQYLKNCNTRGCQAVNFEIHKNVYQPVEVKCLVTKTMFQLMENHITEEQMNKMREEF